MQEKVIVETQRVRLREIRAEDFGALARILQNIEVMYAWEHAFSDDEVAEWIAENRARYARDGYSYWAAIEKAGGALLGVCGLIAETADEEEYLGIGYVFHRDYWGRGLALECAAACKHHAFTALGVSLLTAQIRPDNIASIRVAEKLGMSVIKPFNRFYRGKLVPHLLYGCSM